MEELIAELYEKYPVAEGWDFDGRCHDCGAEVRISINLSGTGIEITGGAMYSLNLDGPEPKADFKCDPCFAQDKILRQKCEVFSRVIGYYRPVDAWNTGQQQQFGNRKTFDRSIET